MLYSVAVSYGYIAVQMLVVLIRTKILTGILDKADYFFLNTVVGTIAFVAVIASLGSFEFTLRALPGLDEAGQRSLIGGLVRGIGGLTVAAVVLLSPVILLLQRSLLPPDVRLTPSEWAAAALGTIAWAHLLQRHSILMARQQMGRFRLVQFLYAECWFLPAIALWALGGADRTALLWTWTGWMLAVAALTAGFVPYRAALRAPRDPRFSLHAVAAFGLPLIPLLMGEQVFRLIDRYFVGGLHGEEAGAEYTLCMNVAMIAYLAGNSILMLIVPRFNRVREARRRLGAPDDHRDPELRHLFCMLLRCGWIFALAAGAGFAAAGPAVLRVLADAKYWDSFPLLAWAAPVSFFFLTFAALSRVLIAFDRTRRVGFITIAGAAVNIALNALLAPRYGGAGAACANWLALACMCALAARDIGLRRWIEPASLKPGRQVLFLVASLVLFRLGTFLPGGALVQLVVPGLLLLTLIPALGLLTKRELTGLFNAN